MSQAGANNTSGGGGGGASSFVEDFGIAAPVAGVIKISGGAGITTSGAGNIITITNTGIATNLTFNTDSTPATSSGGVITFNGSGGLLFSGSGSTVTGTLAAIPNASLANSSVTVTAGTGLTGGGSVALGGTITLNATGSGTVTNVSGTAGQIDVANGTTTPVISIDAAYVGQTSITTLGTISTGTWAATTIAANHGGTGVANAVGSTITLGGALTTSGAFSSTFTMTNTTSVTFPTSGTLATTSQLPSITATQYDVLVGGAANAIVSVGPGSAGQVLQSGGNASNPAYSTATYPATATGTGKVLIADGTNWVASTPTFPNASATSGKIIQSDGTNWIATAYTLAAPGSSGNFLKSDGTNWTSASFSGISGTATQYDVIVGAAGNTIASVGPGSAGQVLQSAGNASNPAYSTATYPSSSGGTGKILYDNGTNFIESTPTFPASASATSRKIIVSDGTNWVASTETWATPGSSGNVLTSDGTNWTSAAPAGGALVWSVITANQTAAINHGYICNKAGLLTLTLPSTAAVGSVIAFVNINTAAGSQFLSANPGQLNLGNVAATANTGTLTSTALGDIVFLVCSTANTTWYAYGVQGNITVA